MCWIWTGAWTLLTVTDVCFHSLTCTKDRNIRYTDCLLLHMSDVCYVQTVNCMPRAHVRKRNFSLMFARWLCTAEHWCNHGIAGDQNIASVGAEIGTAKSARTCVRRKDILHKDEAGVKHDLCPVVRPREMRRGGDPRIGAVVFGGSEKSVPPGVSAAPTARRVEAAVWPGQQRGHRQGACALVSRSVPPKANPKTGRRRTDVWCVN